LYIQLSQDTQDTATVYSAVPRHAGYGISALFRVLLRIFIHIRASGSEKKEKLKEANDTPQNLFLNTTMDFLPAISARSLHNVI